MGEREHLWDDARTEARTEPTPSNEPPRSSPPTAVPRGSTRSSTRPKPKASASEDPPADDEERTGLDWRFMGVAAVALAVAAGFGGWWFGSRRAQAALEMVAVEQQKARVEGARGAIKELDHELLGILRQTLGNEPLRKRIDEARGDLDALEKLVTTDAEREKVAALRAKLGELTDGRADATKLLALLEAEGNAATLSPAQITAELGTLRSALGALYADLAAESTARGDAARAERMLVVAISVDPANTSRYEAQRAGKKDGSQ